MTAVYQGTAYSRAFTVTGLDLVTPVNITGWTFKIQIRRTIADTTVLLELTTANGGVVVLSGAAGRMGIVISAAQSLTLPVGNLAFDILRTDVVPGPTWLAGGRIPVKEPVTR